MSVQKYFFKIDPKVKIFGGFLILIVVSYLLYDFSVAPLLNRQKILKVNLASQKRLVETRRANITKISSLEAELGKRKKELEDIEKKFIVEEKLPSFFAELRDLAGKNNINISMLRVGEKKPITMESEEEEPPQYAELPVDISLNGGYLDTAVFLTQFRERPLMLTVSKMSMLAQDEEAKSIRTDFELILYLVYK